MGAKKKETTEDSAPIEAITLKETPTRHFAEGKMTLSNAVQTAFKDAVAGKSKLTETVLGIEGMSGKKYRMFINNLVSYAMNPRYLEVGSWAGSTLCSAIYGNNVTATAIDNWSQFGGPSNMFFFNVAQSCSPTTRLSVLNQDFRQVDYPSLGRFNIYLFDGPHAFEDQRDGLLMALDCLDNEFVFIVDDWNWEAVRGGTMNAIALAGLTVMWSAEVRSSDDGSQPKIRGQNSDWHNGYYIAIMRK